MYDNILNGVLLVDTIEWDKLRAESTHTHRPQIVHKHRESIPNEPSKNEKQSNTICSAEIVESKLPFDVPLLLYAIPSPCRPLLDIAVFVRLQLHGVRDAPVFCLLVASTSVFSFLFSISQLHTHTA